MSGYGQLIPRRDGQTAKAYISIFLFFAMALPA